MNLTVTYDSAAFLPSYRKPQFRQEGHEVLDLAASLFNSTPCVVVGESRVKPLVHCRWGVMLALSRKGWSTPRIGRLLGDRDHTTIMYGIRKAREMYRDNTVFRLYCDELARAA